MRIRRKLYNVDLIDSCNPIDARDALFFVGSRVGIAVAYFSFCIQNIFDNIVPCDERERSFPCYLRAGKITQARFDQPCHTAALALCYGTFLRGMCAFISASVSLSFPPFLPRRAYSAVLIAKIKLLSSRCIIYISERVQITRLSELLLRAQ